MDNNTTTTPAAHLDQDIMMMRDQLLLLQKKLDERVHFEDRMIRRAMTKNVGNLLQMEWIGLFICIMALVVSMAQVHVQHLSVALQLFTGLWMLVMVVVQAWSVWYVAGKRRDVIEGNLLRVSERIIVYKRADRWCKRIFLPLVVVWIVIYLHEVVISSAFAESVAYQIGVYVGGVLGAALGGIIGWMIYRKMMGYVNELQEQVEDLKRE